MKIMTYSIKRLDVIDKFSDPTLNRNFTWNVFACQEVQFFEAVGYLNHRYHKRRLSLRQESIAIIDIATYFFSFLQA